MAAISPHPNLAMILGTEDWREVPLLVVEYLEGGTLADRLRQEQLAVDDVIELGIALADALDHVHLAGVLHRDIKPTNIGYTREGVPKLLDFGVAMMLHPTASPATWEHPVVDRPQQAAKGTDHASTATSLTTADHGAGTLLYLSPEALESSEPSPSFDLWSLTVVLFEALTGHNPFDAPTVPDIMDKIRYLHVPDVRDVRDGCHESLAVFFQTGLTRNTSHRPSSAADFRSRLQRVYATVRAERVISQSS